MGARKVPPPPGEPPECPVCTNPAKWSIRHARWGACSPSCSAVLSNSNSPNSTIKPKSHWLAQVWDGRYRLVDSGLPKMFGVRSKIRVTLRSDAGHERETEFGNLYYASKKDFPHPVSKSELLGKRYGSLVVTGVPGDWVFVNGSDPISCHCDCGLDTEKKLGYLENGDTSTCGECNWKAKEEWFAGKYNKLKLVPESESEHNRSLELPGRFGAHHCKGVKVEVACDCGKTNVTRMDGLLSMNTLSCGCALNENFSSASDTLGEFLSSLGLEVIKSDRDSIPPRELDFFIPQCGLGIEYHGAHWHSEARRSDADKLKDCEKYSMCVAAGIDLIQVYNDEWSNKREIFEDLIRKRVGMRGRRVYGLVVREVPHGMASLFLDGNHYLGRASGSIRIGLFSKDELVGVAVITRNGESRFECTRFAIKLGVRTYRPFLKVIGWLRMRYGSGCLTSFSDNRLHTGNSYAGYGFRQVATLKPDYCYTNGVKREHKFNFRVSAGVGERGMAATRNFYRLWDSGKKKWELEW